MTQPGLVVPQLLPVVFQADGVRDATVSDREGEADVAARRGAEGAGGEGTPPSLLIILEERVRRRPY